MKFDIKDLGLIGVMADQEGYELPPNGLTTAHNVRCEKGWIQRVAGYAPVFSATAVVPYFITPYSTTTTDYIVHCGLAAVYVDDGGARTDITGTAPTGTAANKWTGGAHHGLLVLNNEVDQPMYWTGDTGANLATLPGWNSAWRCKALRPFKDYLLAINVTKSGTNYPHMVKWSHVSDPGTIPTSWDETDASKDAGEQDLAETPDPLVDGLPLGDQFIVYGARSAYSMQFIEQPYIWRFQRLPGDHGLIGPNCVAQTPLGHVCLTQGDVILHSGGFPRSIVDARMRRWLFDQLNSTSWSACWVAHNPHHSEVWIGIPASGEAYCTKALVWSYASDTFSTRDLPNVTHAAPGVVSYTTSSISWSAISGTWETITGTWADYESFSPRETRLFFAGAGSKIYVADESNQADGVDFTSTVERTGIDLGAPEVRKLATAIWPRIDADTGVALAIQVGASENAETSPTWAAAQTFTVGTTNKIDALSAGRYLSYRIEGSTASAWRVRSLSVEYRTLGMF